MSNNKEPVSYSMTPKGTFMVLLMMMLEPYLSDLVIADLAFNEIGPSLNILVNEFVEKWKHPGQERMWEIDADIKAWNLLKEDTPDEEKSSES